MLGKNIAKYRKQKKISQSALGEMFNVTQGAVSQWERGVTAPDIPTIKEIAKVLGVSFGDLVGDDGFYPHPQSTPPLMLDGQPTRGLRDDKPETQAIAAKVLSEALNHGMTEDEALAFIRNYAQLMPQERKTIMSNMMFLRSQHNEEEGT